MSLDFALDGSDDGLIFTESWQKRPGISLSSGGGGGGIYMELDMTSQRAVGRIVPGPWDTGMRRHSVIWW